MGAWNWFVSQDEWVIVAGVSVIPVASALLIFFLGRPARVGAYFQPDLISMAYLGAITLLFSLFSAFMLGDIWQREAAISDLVYKEAQELRLIADLGVICGAPCEAIAGASRSYAAALVDLEWNEEWSDASPLSQQRLEAIVPLLAELEANAAVGSSVRSGLLGAYDQLQRLRSERYALINYDMAPHRWVMITLLGVLTQIAIASLNVGRPVALATVLGVFTAAFVAVLAYTALLAWPTVEETVLPPALLRQITAPPG